MPERSSRIAAVTAAVRKGIASRGARFHEIRDCRHLAPTERPGEVTMLLRDSLRHG